MSNGHIKWIIFQFISVVGRSRFSIPGQCGIVCDGYVPVSTGTGAYIKLIHSLTIWNEFDSSENDKVA